MKFASESTMLLGFERFLLPVRSQQRMLDDSPEFIRTASNQVLEQVRKCAGGVDIGKRQACPRLNSFRKIGSVFFNAILKTNLDSADVSQIRQTAMQRLHFFGAVPISGFGDVPRAVSWPGRHS